MGIIIPDERLSRTISKVWLPLETLTGVQAYREEAIPAAEDEALVVAGPATR